MARDFDRNMPGPAGLMLDPSTLTDIGWKAERAARRALERFCFACGQPASFGFGCFADEDGIWACVDGGCRAKAEARVSSAAAPPRAASIPTISPFARTLLAPLMAAE